MINIPLKKKTKIDWNKVQTFEELRDILQCIDYGLDISFEDDGSEKFDSIRHLFKEE